MKLFITKLVLVFINIREAKWKNASVISCVMKNAIRNRKRSYDWRNRRNVAKNVVSECIIE